jgi:hypothetical protein
VTVVASSNDRRPSRLFVLASLQALHLDRGSGRQGSRPRRRAVEKEHGR